MFFTNIAIVIIAFSKGIREFKSNLSNERHFWYWGSKRPGLSENHNNINGLLYYVPIDELRQSIRILE